MGKGAIWFVGLALCCAPGHADKNPASPFDFSGVNPPTFENVGQAAREKMVKPGTPPPPDRLFEIGFGVGVPYLATVEIGLQLLKRFQFGMAYSGIPGGLVPKINLPDQSTVLSTGETILMEPVMSSAMDMFSPFVRYFPTERTFYIQLTWGIMRSTHNVVSPLIDETFSLAIPGAYVNGTVAITTQMPTLALGYFFWRHFFFANVAIGATFIASSTAASNLSASVPGGFGTITPAQTQQINQAVDQGLQTAVADFRQKFLLLPSLLISTGVMF